MLLHCRLNPSSMFFFPTSPYKISLIIFKTISKFRACWDNIPSFVLKYLPFNFLSALSYIFDLSLFQEKISSYFKHSKVIPVFLKKVIPTIFQTSVPSLLSHLSKILEKNCAIEFILFLLVLTYFQITNLVSDMVIPLHM